MSVFREKDRKAFRYKFIYRGQVYKGSTGQLTLEDAQAFELREQQRVRRAEAGLTDLRDAPAFQEWAGVYYTHKATSRQKVKRPDQIDFLLRTVLKFWGRQPRDPAKIDPHAPYHDLTLADPIQRPELLDEFDAWMEAQGFSGSHRNHLRTQVSGMYRVAALPAFRKRTGITAAMNPMDGVPRDRRRVRVATVSPEQLVAWVRVAAYHVRLAIAIAALAPKLRLGNVLALEWRVHVDRELTRITVTDHKTDADSLPIVQLVSAQLRDILEDARRRSPSRWVVSYRGRRVKQIRDGVRAAAERAGIPYGRHRRDGATFHTIRHAMATLFAQLRVAGHPLSESERAALLAHADISTTQIYTHLNPVHELPALEALAGPLPLAELVKQPWKKWSKTRMLKAGPPAAQARGKSGKSA